MPKLYCTVLYCTEKRMTPLGERGRERKEKEIFKLSVSGSGCMPADR
jgi:hypothetical protein